MTASGKIVASCTGSPCTDTTSNGAVFACPEGALCHVEDTSPGVIYVERPMSCPAPVDHFNTGATIFVLLVAMVCLTSLFAPLLAHLTKEPSE